MLLSTFRWSYSEFYWEHMLRKKKIKMAYLFRLQSHLFFIQSKGHSIPSQIWIQPLWSCFKGISNIIREIPLQKFSKEITLKFDKTITKKKKKKFQHSSHSILLISIEIKGNYKVPTSLIYCFWYSSFSLFKMSLYFWNSSAIFILFFLSWTRNFPPFWTPNRKHAWNFGMQKGDVTSL